MGLDMYLYRRHYVKNLDFIGDERWDVMILHNGEALPVTQLDHNKVVHIDEEVAYWRKANAIHAWFVRECQGGVDNCSYSYVGEEQLQDLLKLVREVLADNSLAATLLPTQGGFFFGSTEYEDWYFEQLRETEKMLAPLVEDQPEDRPGFDEYMYHASW